MNKLIELSLLLPVFIPFVISGLLFFNSEYGNRSKRLLSIFMFNIALLFAGLYILFFKYYNLYAAILSFHVLQLFLVFPGIYIYVKMLIDNNYSFKFYYKHFYPIIIIIPTAVVFYFLIDSNERYMFVTELRYRAEWSNWAMVFLYFVRIINIVIIIFQFVFYWFITNKLLRKYTVEINNIFSNTEGISLNGVKVLNNTLFIGSLSCMGFYAFNPIKIFENGLFLLIALGIISVAIFLLGIIGLRQKMLPQDIIVEEEIEPVVEEIDNDIDLYKKLLKYFDTNKPYLNAELRIENLVLELSTNRTHLSNAINKFSGKNFNQFVNDYRIGESKIMIANKNRKVSSEEIGMAVGFGSVRTFERNFKNIEGVSVGEYVKSVSL